MGLLCIGSKLYAESGFTLYHLYVETRNKPMYGSGRSMQDKLESGMGLPLMRPKCSPVRYTIPALE